MTEMSLNDTIYKKREEMILDIVNKLIELNDRVLKIEQNLANPKLTEEDFQRIFDSDAKAMEDMYKDMAINDCSKGLHNNQKCPCCDKEYCVICKQEIKQ